MINIFRMVAIMEAPTGDAQKLPDMVMCGDHPSVTKTELNAKDSKADEKEKEKLKEKSMLSYAKISPTHSRTEGVTEARGLVTSEHVLRLHEARRRARDIERERADPAAPASPASPAANRPLVQSFPFAAIGSFRWPPYLLAVWVLVLVLTHALHCLVNMLEKALPALKRCTAYFRTWTEETWKSNWDINYKLCPLGLAVVTGFLYALYFGLYTVYAVVLWSIEPLCADGDEGPSRSTDVEPKVTDYIDIVNSKTNSSLKQ